VAKVAHHTNTIGKLGEAWLVKGLLKPIKDKGFLFDLQFLGDKYPLVDYIVDLHAIGNEKMFFFASVKHTTKGKYKRLPKINIDKEELKGIRKYVIPVYIFAIDSKNDKIYFVSGNGIDATKDMNGFPMKHLLTGDTLVKIWDEVKQYCETSKKSANFKSNFIL
jgi:hypothetical protein